LQILKVLDHLMHIGITTNSVPGHAGQAPLLLFPIKLGNLILRCFGTWYGIIKHMYVQRVELVLLVTSKKRQNLLRQSFNSPMDNDMA
jgi:hypothetical protein